MADVPPCVFCGAVFESRELLQEHFRTHGNNGRRTNADERKQSRSPYITTRTPVKCEICSMTFDCISRAIAHKYKVHGSHQEYHFCPWCGKHFPLKHTLEIHIKIHSDELRSEGSFECLDCKTDFYKQEAYEYHRMSYHENIIFARKVNTAPSKKISINSCGSIQSIYYCPLCGQEYVVKFNLQRHLNASHDIETEFNTDEMIKCNLCDAYFYNKRAYDFHNTFHKPDDVYVTDEESRLNVVTQVDQDFDFKRVRNLFNDKCEKFSKKVITGTGSPPKHENRESYPAYQPEKVVNERSMYCRDKLQVPKKISPPVVKPPQIVKPDSNVKVKYLTPSELRNLKTKMPILSLTNANSVGNLKKIGIVKKANLAKLKASKVMTFKPAKIPVIRLERLPQSVLDEHLKRSSY